MLKILPPSRGNSTKCGTIFIIFGLLQTTYGLGKSSKVAWLLQIINYMQ
jgi:hypothetical protein